MDGDVLRLGQQLAGRGEERRGAVGPLPDVRAERRPLQDHAHDLGDPRQLADQDLETGRVELAHRGSPALRWGGTHRRITQAPLGWTSPRHPSGTQMAQSDSAIATGPWTTPPEE